MNKPNAGNSVYALLALACRYCDHYADGAILWSDHGTKNKSIWTDNAAVLQLKSS
jgi:hypothetical protein